MRPIIYKQIEESNGVERLSVRFMGLLVYVREYPIDDKSAKRPIGFVSFPIEAPSEVYDYENDYLDKKL